MHKLLFIYFTKIITQAPSEIHCFTSKLRISKLKNYQLVILTISIVPLVVLILALLKVESLDWPGGLRSDLSVSFLFVHRGEEHHQLRALMDVNE